MSRVFTVLAVVVAVVGLAIGRPNASVGASQPATPAADQPITVPVDVHDMADAPALTILRVGQTYLFVVTNRGKATHEFVVEPDGAVDKALEANGKAAEAENIAPGQ